MGESRADPPLLILCPECSPWGLLCQRAAPAQPRVALQQGHNCTWGAGDGEAGPPWGAGEGELSLGGPPYSLNT